MPGAELGTALLIRQEATCYKMLRFSGFFENLINWLSMQPFKYWMVVAIVSRRSFDVD